MMIQLNDFASLFQLFAGINLAFIAVNYFDDYTNIIANKIFQIDLFVKENFDHLLSEIKKKTASLGDLNLNKLNFVSQTNELQRMGENHVTSLLKKSEEVRVKATKECYFKTFSSTCLWSFLFCCFIMFLSGYEKINKTYINKGNIQESVFLLSLLSVAFFIACWSVGDSQNKYIRNWLCRLSHVLLICVLSFFISSIISLLINIHEFLDKYYVYLILLAILIPCINFIFFIIPTFYKVSKIKKETREYISNFKKSELEEYIKKVYAIFMVKKWELDVKDSELSFESKVTHCDDMHINQELMLHLNSQDPSDLSVEIHSKGGKKIGEIAKGDISKLIEENNTLRFTKCQLISITLIKENEALIKFSVSS